ncbi:MAG: hypothetical protein GY893_14695 [bacterium]|nr:hypothetical protein [bacterium]
MKTAAQHFENSIACHVATGSDMGDMGHGRKQFNEIMRAAEIFIDNETRKYLIKPMDCTGLPPHFYVTADKATVNRYTNQAVMLCCMVQGKRRAIPVSASQIYEVADDEDDEDDIDNAEKLSVTGASASELAARIHSDIKETYQVDDELLCQSWQGTSCDGQYQAKDFGKELQRLLQQTGSFSCVIWDPPHLVDLALKDVFKGSFGESDNFMKRLISRSAVFHHLFGRGKMFVQAKVQAAADETKLLVTSRTCSTRFATSQYYEFVKLLESLPTYVKAFRKYGYTEVKDFQMAGQDFVFDICGAVDIMRPIITLLVELQNLQAPVWKILIWQRRVVDELEKMTNFSTEDLTPKMVNLTAHITDIKNMTYKGTQLVQGWLMEGQSKGGEEEEEPVIDWTARELEDCEGDLQLLARDLLNSLKARLANVSRMQKKLTSMDLDSIIGHVTGKRNASGCVKIDEAALEHYGHDEFKEFFAYVCSQDHVQTLATSKDVILDPSLSHVIHRKLKVVLKELVWHPKYIDLLVDCLKVVREDGTTVLLQSYLNEESDVMEGPVVDKIGRVEKFEILAEDGAQFFLSNTYAIKVKCGTFKVIVCEENILKNMYTNQEIYKALGLEMCICIDISQAKGGTEAVVESFYSSMKAQSMHGGQDTTTLAMRTKLEWSIPPVIQADRVISGTADVYLNGDKSRSFKSHKWPTIGDGNKGKRYKVSKVVDRIESEEPSLPFLI